MKILIPYDGSVSSEAAVEDTLRAGLPRDAKTLVLTAGSDVAHINVLTDAACDRIQTQFPQWNLSSQAVKGTPSEIILNATRWWRPDLLIIGSESFPLERTRATSVALDLVHRARCSVRVVRARKNSPNEPIRLVVGNNGSKACEAVLREVASRQWPRETKAHVIRVVDPSSPSDWNEQDIHPLREAGLTVSRTIIHGDPRQDLVREAERSKADTIFVGPRSVPAASRFLLGSVATAVVTRARSSVEVVRR